MPSTRQTTASAVHSFSLLALFTLLSATATTAASHHLVALPPLKRDARHAPERRALSAMTYSGCYSSSDGLANQGSYTYQTSGYCQPICVDLNDSVLAVSGGSNCWCGDTLPPSDSKVTDSYCDTPCNGYDKEDCGGTGYWSVYLSGLTENVSNYGASSSSPASSTTSTTGSSSSSGSAAKSTNPSTAAIVVTSVAPGTTIIVTEAASGVSTSSATSTGKTSGTSKSNTAGVAAGVVVGVVLAVAGIVALVFWIKHKRRKEAESEYKRKNQAHDFLRASRGEPKPPSTGYSNMSDSRLDPEAGARRNSVGSIADDRDYSRKILRVANPDRS